MVFIYGQRLYGKIDAAGESYIATKFAHMWYLPLFPVGSVLVHKSTSNGYESVPIAFNWRSMLAGYMRMWGAVGVGFALIALVSTIIVVRETSKSDGFREGLTSVLPVALVCLVMVGALVFVSVVFGRLSVEERRKRAGYAEFIGYHVDPVLLDPLRLQLLESVTKTVVDRAGGLAQTGYRLPADPATNWMQIALDPQVQDPLLVAAAMTLARLASREGDAATRAKYATAHRDLWQRLMQMNPPFIQKV